MYSLFSFRFERFTTWCAKKTTGRKFQISLEPTTDFKNEIVICDCSTPVLKYLMHTLRKLVSREFARSRKVNTATVRNELALFFYVVLILSFDAS